MERWASEDSQADVLLPAQGRCAAHPDRVADQTCDRCGDNLCPECCHLVQAAALCSACLAREGGPPAVVPWEDKKRPFFLRIYESIDGLVLRPSRVMARLPEGKRSPALWLLALLTFVPLAIFATFVQGTKGLGAGLFGLLVAIPAAWIGALAAAIAARIAGARGSMDFVGRAVIYAWIGGVGAAHLTVVAVWSSDTIGSAAHEAFSVLAIWMGFAVGCALITRAMWVFARGALKLGRPAALAVAVASITPLWLPLVALAVMRALR